MNIEVSSLKQYLRDFSGTMFRHIPDMTNNKVDDFRHCGKYSGRWNYQTEKCLYLASEKDVALAEWARSLEPAKFGLGQKRQLYSFVEIELSSILDLRNNEVYSCFRLGGSTSMRLS